MELSPQAIGALAALAGVLLASLFSLITSALNRRSEERKHYRQLIINAAVENWKHVAQSLLAHGVRGNFMPLDDYVLHMMKFTELMIDQKLDDSNLEQKLKEISAFTDRLTAYRTKELNKDRNR